MKRESRQHGMVRTYRVLPTPLSPNPQTRFATRFPSPIAPTRPAKSAGCHVTACNKARDKAKSKGTQKSKSYDAVSNYRMVTWHVGDARPFSFSGTSATVILGELCDSYRDDRDYDDPTVGDDYSEEEEVDPTVEDDDDDRVEEINGGDDHGSDDDDDVAGGFCDVGFVMEQVEGEDGWCLVAEM